MTVPVNASKTWPRLQAAYNVLIGKHVPGWAPPVFAATAAAPVIGYELDESRREKNHQAEELKNFIRYGYNPPAVMRKDLKRNEASASMPLSAQTDETATPRSSGQATGPGGTLKTAEKLAADLDTIKDALRTLKARRDSTPRGAPLRAGAHKLAKD